MGNTFNIYCDESCHLLNDRKQKMFLGAIWCPTDSVNQISKEIFELKKKHNIGHNVELKWTKVSQNKINFYFDLIDYFFNQENLHFRCLIINDKNQLNHTNYTQTHDEWYYKMYFTLIKVILDSKNNYRIYIDIKDTKSANKIEKLHQVLSNNIYDFDKKIVERVQTIRSHESNLLQITDILLGAVSHFNRSEIKSSAKSLIIEKIKQRSNKTLKNPTLLGESKFNLFFWDAKTTT